jgi:hypothetical protein
MVAFIGRELSAGCPKFGQEAIDITSTDPYHEGMIPYLMEDV